MNLAALTAFNDNTFWMRDGKHALVRDPAEASPVPDALVSRHVACKAILVTCPQADPLREIDAPRVALGALRPWKKQFR
jgi:hypothetical protein